jgi:putative membrane protein
MCRSLPLLVTVASLAACAPRDTVQPETPVLTSGTEPTAQLDDGAIATVAIAIADGQAERARLAKERTKSESVREFATRILNDAPAAAIETMALAPRTSIMQDEITNSTVGDLGYLETWHGEDFDRAFISDERRSLADAIALLDHTLIPSATNDQLKHELLQMRHSLDAEYEHARFLGAAIPSMPKNIPP